jgi:hypothetical protein
MALAIVNNMIVYLVTESFHNQGNKIRLDRKMIYNCYTVPLGFFRESCYIPFLRLIPQRILDIGSITPVIATIFTNRYFSFVSYTFLGTFATMHTIGMVIHTKYVGSFQYS